MIMSAVGHDKQPKNERSLDDESLNHIAMQGEGESGRSIISTDGLYMSFHNGSFCILFPLYLKTHLYIKRFALGPMANRLVASVRRDINNRSIRSKQSHKIIELSLIDRFYGTTNDRGMKRCRIH